MRPDGRVDRRWWRMAQVAPVALSIAVGAGSLAATAAASSPPTIEAESVGGVTDRSASLQAQIDPKGLETTYHFEIARSGACLPGEPSSMPCSQVETGNLPSGTIVPSSQDILVTLDLSTAGISLEPSTTYEYRVIASNSDGSAEGLIQSFTTSAATVGDSQPATPTPSGSTETKQSQTAVQPQPHQRPAHRRHHRKHRHRRTPKGSRHRS